MTAPIPTVPAEAVLDQMSDAVIYADRDGNIRLWNRAAVGLFGYEASEALGSSIDIMVPERLREPHWRGFNAAIASGTLKLSGRPTLTRAQHKDGSRLYIEMSFALVKDADGSPIGSVAVARAAAPPRATERQ
jgi:PAS domain S-box-containing protein